MGFFHFHELLVLFSSGVDMIAEQNVMLASGRGVRSHVVQVGVAVGAWIGSPDRRTVG